MLNSFPIQNERVAYTVVDEEAVLVSPVDSSMYWLNLVASRIWVMADGRHSVAEIANELCAEFDVDYDSALRDVSAMVNSFTAKKLMTLSDGDVR
jgi:hypothetical protein